MPEIRSAKEKPENRLFGLTLSDIDIHWQRISDLDDVEYEYSVTIDSPEILESDLIFFSTNIIVQANNRESQEKLRAVSVTYFCAIASEKRDDQTAKTLARKYAETTVWGAFTSLFAIVSQQMGAVFPMLPPSPANVKIADRSMDATEN